MKREFSRLFSSFLRASVTRVCDSRSLRTVRVSPCISSSSPYFKTPSTFFRISSATSRAFGHLLPLWDCSNHCSHHGFFRCSSASASPASHAPSRVLDAPPLRDLRSFFPFLHSLILCACRCVSSYCTMITRLFSVLAERVRVVLRLRFQQVMSPAL